MNNNLDSRAAKISVQKLFYLFIFLLVLVETAARAKYQEVEELSSDYREQTKLSKTVTVCL